MAKVERVKVASGDAFLIECAVRADFSSPVSEFLDQLAAGRFEVRRNPELDSLEAQSNLYMRFVAGMEFLAEHGELPQGSLTFNSLEDGIWEFKPGSLRVTFFDTDGRGNHIAKRRERNFVTGQIPWPDDYDYFLRLATAFEKRGRRAEPGHIYTAKKVREEDLEHDLGSREDDC